jgi:hypothetical protein
MTSQDTLGGGVAANAGSGINATVNASIPDISRPWGMKVSSIEGGVGLPGFAVSTTFTPQQITDFLNRYIFNRPGPNNRAEFVRDSAVAAGVPSRKNVFEYGFPDHGALSPNVFQNGVPSVPYLPRPQQRAGGLPRLLSSLAGSDPSDPTQPAPPRLGRWGWNR